MQPQQEKYNVWSSIMLILIFAFVFAVFGYVGQGLLQTVKVWQTLDPKVIIPTMIIGVVLALIIQARRRNQS